MNGPASPDRSAAVLIGVSQYKHLEDLPGIRANVEDLADQMRDPSVWGLPTGRCHVVLEPLNATAAFDPLRATDDFRLDTLLVYYAGHGLLISSDCCRGADAW